MSDRQDLLPYSLDERLLTELAQGLEDPVVVLQRADYTEEEATALIANPYVIRQVENLRAELEKTGDMDVLRDVQHGRMLTEHMMLRVLSNKVKDEHILKMIELLDKRKERRAQAEREANAGVAAGFQVVITLPGANRSLTVGVSDDGHATSLPMYVRSLEPDIIDVTPEETT